MKISLQYFEINMKFNFHYIITSLCLISSNCLNFQYMCGKTLPSSEERYNWQVVRLLVFKQVHMYKHNHEWYIIPSIALGQAVNHRNNHFGSIQTTPLDEEVYEQSHIHLELLMPLMSHTDSEIAPAHICFNRTRNQHLGNTVFPCLVVSSV